MRTRLQQPKSSFSPVNLASCSPRGVSVIETSLLTLFGKCSLMVRGLQRSRCAFLHMPCRPAADRLGSCDDDDHHQYSMWEGSRGLAGSPTRAAPVTPASLVQASCTFVGTVITRRKSFTSRHLARRRTSWPTDLENGRDECIVLLSARTQCMSVSAPGTCQYRLAFKFSR